ncbi:MAG TPA: glycosyltransferase [Isosphaeraceae bacterium]
MKLSVAICSYNPRPDYLSAVLEALAEQTLSVDRWELLLVDNASDRPLADRFDLSWHPNGRHVREEQLGLTMARVRGITESDGDPIVFLDDDNLLDTDYLEVAARIGREWPILGTWGGRIDPVFESEPPEWTRPYWLLLAIRQPTSEAWSNLIGLHEANPFGAGLCVRRGTAQAYARRVLDDPRHRALDRRGSSLLGAGDLDIAFTGHEAGQGAGVFPCLRLRHLIPDSRLRMSYLIRLMEDSTFSNTVLLGLYGRIEGLRPRSAIKRWISPGLGLRWGRRQRLMELARMRGRERALKHLAASTATGGLAPPTRLIAAPSPAECRKAGP